MSKREKIISMLALAVVIYGLVHFLILSKDNSLKIKKVAPVSNKITADFVMESLTKISKIETLARQPHWKALVSKIESPWEKDPFVPPLEPETLPDTSSLSSPVTRFVYSGYMNVGKISFAVINGVEYKIGETIKEYEYKITKITPKKVVLQKDTEQAVIFLKEE